MTRQIKPEEVNNRFEVSILKSLKSHKRKTKIDIAYESEKLDYTIQRNYIPDFVITRSDGSKVYIEGKGYFRPESRSKMIAVKKQHPEKDIRFIFQRNDKLRKSTTKYSDWADRHGFPWHIGEDVPKEWLYADS